MVGRRVGDGVSEKREEDKKKVTGYIAYVYISSPTHTLQTNESGKAANLQAFIRDAFNGDWLFHSK